MNAYKLLFLSTIISLGAVAQDFLPSNIVLLDNKFSHHVVIAEKSTHTLYLYENSNSTPKLLKKYKIATGKFSGNKYVEGDKKTPEGIYNLTDFIPDTELIKKYGQKQGEIYGAGAFTSNYPNFIDRSLGKTGGGIWLHSTNDNSRINKGLDSKGCVVVVDEDLKDISQYIDLKNTSMVIVENLNYLNNDSWNELRTDLVGLVKEWQKAWEEKNFEKYISFYDSSRFYNPRKGKYEEYKRYKKAIFSLPGTPSIKFQHLSILVHQNYAVVQMQQDYKSETIDDLGKKTLYLQKNSDYEWKIVAEQWSKLDKEKRNIAFVPSMRFFKN